MIIAMIEGATRIIGKRQGYLGLPIRDVLINCTVNGPETPAMDTAWEPTPDEIERIVKGAKVRVRILGRVHPPLMVEVGDVPEPVETN
jgi:hypothetical protein